MKKLKIFDAVEEVMRMDELQLVQARKRFNWAYLRSALDELENYFLSSPAILDGYQPQNDLDEELNPPTGGSNFTHRR